MHAESYSILAITAASTETSCVVWRMKLLAVLEKLIGPVSSLFLCSPLCSALKLNPIRQFHLHHLGFPGLSSGCGEGLLTASFPTLLDG